MTPLFSCAEELAMTRMLLCALIIGLTGCATQPDRPVRTIAAGDDALESAVALLAKGQAADAVNLHLAPLVTRCMEQYANSDRRLFAARSPAETMFYLMLAAAEGNGRSAAVISTPCADAHYLKGYAHVELGNVDEAEQHLARALEWSPRNSQYLSQLGHLYHIKEDWAAALETFNRAEDASSLSLEEVKDAHRARALRGAGYSLIELGDLDEAENKYYECLEINPNDRMALDQLDFIQTLRNQN